MSQPLTRSVLALSGGVGGAKLALGLARVLPADHLTIVANTADDFEHLGLYISPDLDTVMYTLAGLSDPQRGWGLAGESWHCLDALRQLGGESWFQLGDRDLATHLQRSAMLRQGSSLTEVTRHLCQQLELGPRILPMTDDSVRTVVMTERGEMPFQHYFVRERCEPRVSGFRFAGIEAARPQVEVLEMLRGGRFDAIVVCPSNPFVSVDPILELPGLRQALVDSGSPIIAVSPIVNGRALKGPAAKMLAELGLPVSAESIASHYRGLVNTFVLDEADATLADTIRALGMDVQVTPTIMSSLDDRERVARAVLAAV